MSPSFVSNSWLVDLSICMSESCAFMTEFNLATVVSCRYLTFDSFALARSAALSSSSSLSASCLSNRCSANPWSSSSLWCDSCLTLPSSKVADIALFWWDISEMRTLSLYSKILISWRRFMICSSFTFIVSCKAMTLSSVWFLSLSRLSTI